MFEPSVAAPFDAFHRNRQPRAEQHPKAFVRYPSVPVRSQNAAWFLTPEFQLSAYFTQAELPLDVLTVCLAEPPAVHFLPEGQRVV